MITETQLIDAGYGRIIDYDGTVIYKFGSLDGEHLVRHSGIDSCPYCGSPRTAPFATKEGCWYRYSCGTWAIVGLAHVYYIAESSKICSWWAKNVHDRQDDII